MVCVKLSCPTQHPMRLAYDTPQGNERAQQKEKEWRFLSCRDYPDDESGTR
jgi:hypothetical protein